MTTFGAGNFHLDFAVSAGLEAGLGASDVDEEELVEEEDAEDSDLALCL